MICEVLLVVGMDQQFVIPDNAYYPYRGDCPISNPNEEYEDFLKNNDVYSSLTAAV